MLFFTFFVFVRTIVHPFPLHFLLKLAMARCVSSDINGNGNDLSLYDLSLYYSTQIKSRKLVARVQGCAEPGVYLF